MIKTLQSVGIEGTFLKFIKTIYEKQTANIIPNEGKKRNITGPLSPLLFNRLLEVLATAFRKQKEIKYIQIGKEEVKLSSQMT